VSNDERTASTIIPATPGWELALYVKGGAGYDPYISCEPIVAWDVERTTGPYDRSVNRPDGKVEVPGDTTFKSEEEWLPYCVENEQDEEDAKWKAKVAAGHSA